MLPPGTQVACGTAAHWNRRTLLQAGVGTGLFWTPIAEALSRAAAADRTQRPRSLILLWLEGGPSQLETFDPHPGKAIAGGTQAISTKVPGIQIAAGYERLAEQMDVVSLVRSVVSKEGDHERATYTVKTGFRPDPTLVHPSLGAILCHQLSDDVEIPRHVSILPGGWPARGGYLGDQYDAFKIYDPRNRIADIAPRVPKDRFDRRVFDLTNVVEREFVRGRLRNVDAEKTLHQLSIQAALKMMSSEQLKAFDITQESAATRAEFGDTPFGRGCLAAVRLVEVGVRCVEVTLSGWDSHANNHEICKSQAKVLDPALAALLAELRKRELFEQTIVLCGGEFGRTPRINPAGGRDHWPHGFTIALAGGGLRGGLAIGETSPDPVPPDKEKEIDTHVRDKQEIENIHATVLQALGIEFQKELRTPVGRPMALSQGKVISALLG